MLISANELFAVVFDPEAKTITVKGAKKFKASFRSIINITKNTIFYASISDGENKTYSNSDLVFTTEKSTTGMSANDYIDVVLYVDDENSVLFAIDSLRLREAHSVTPSDDVDIPEGIGFIVVFGTAGNVEVITANGQTVIISLDKNELFPLLCRRVKANLTTAVGIYMVR